MTSPNDFAECIDFFIKANYPQTPTHPALTERADYARTGITELERKIETDKMWRDFYEKNSFKLTQ